MGLMLDRRCNKCGLVVEQYVDFKDEDGRIEISVYRAQCPACNGFLNKPTPGEVRRALIGKAQDET